MDVIEYFYWGITSMFFFWIVRFEFYCMHVYNFSTVLFYYYLTRVAKFLSLGLWEASKESNIREEYKEKSQEPWKEYRQKLKKIWGKQS